MGEKLRTFATKYWDILSYLFFGALTTAVNWAVYTPVYYATRWVVVSNVIAWIAAVAFAYLTNKPFVFKSHDWSAKTVWPELGKFVSCRIGSGVLETGMLALTVYFLGWNSMVMKIIVSVVVVILNYIGSKLLVFHKKTKKED